jgi:hypothetical protein
LSAPDGVRFPSTRRRHGIPAQPRFLLARRRCAGRRRVGRIQPLQLIALDGPTALTLIGAAIVLSAGSLAIGVEQRRLRIVPRKA